MFRMILGQNKTISRLQNEFIKHPFRIKSIQHKMTQSRVKSRVKHDYKGD